MKVVEFPNRNKEVAELLESIKKEDTSLEFIIVLGMYDDGSQMIRTTSGSHLEKCFLGVFFQAWLSRWFGLEERE